MKVIQGHQTPEGRIKSECSEQRNYLSIFVNTTMKAREKYNSVV